MNIRHWISTQRYRLGLLSHEELRNELLPDRQKFLERCQPSERTQVKALWDQLDSTKSLANFSAYLDSAAQFGKVMERVSKRDSVTDHDKIGALGTSIDSSFSMQGGNTWRYFMNPFSAFTAFAELHWAFNCCVDQVLTEILYDGWTLRFKNKNATDAFKKAIKQRVEDYRIPQIRYGMVRHSMTYGNALVLPHTNSFTRGVSKFELLVMDRAFPVFNSMTESVDGWDYWSGTKSTVYKKGELIHLISKPSLRYPDIGVPPASCLAVDTEADLGASSLNNTVIHKAGTFGLVLSLKTPPDGDFGSDRNTKLIRRIQADIRNMHSGVKGANSVLVSNYIDKVDKVAGIGDFDGSFGQFRQAVGLAYASVFKVDPSRLNLNLKSTGVYEAKQVHGGTSEDSDKAIHSWVAPVDETINKIMFPMMGIDPDEVEFVAMGRYGNLTLNGAQAGLIASQTGPLFTKNDLLVHFYGRPPVDDPSGDQIIDNSSMRDPELLKPPMMPSAQPQDQNAPSTGAVTHSPKPPQKKKK